VRPWLLACLASCITAAGCSFLSARDDLAKLMDREVGRTPGDLDSYRANFPSLSRGSRKLPNGNLEEEWRAGFRDDCPVFFEVDPETRKVLAWRLGLPDDDCILADPAQQALLKEQDKPPAKK
jgi:hypothetical protein